MKEANSSDYLIRLCDQTTEKHMETLYACITKEQLDTPLCDIFGDTKTNGTARIFVISSEKEFGLESKDLENMKYEEMNKYIESLDYLWDK